MRKRCLVKHCLVRTPPHVLLAQAAERHRDQRCAASTTSVPVWLGRLRSESVAWRTRGPGRWDVEWCLEVEPAANGTLAHLTVVALDGDHHPYGRLADTVLAARARRELSALVRTCESEHGPYRRLPAVGVLGLDETGSPTPGAEVQIAATDVASAR